MTHTCTERKRILFLDDHVPYPELGVGYPRAKSLVHALHQMGHSVTFVPLEQCTADPELLKRVLPREVQTALGVHPWKLASFLSERIRGCDLLFASRPNNMGFLLTALSRMPPPMRSIPILYDLEASFATREVLYHAVAGLPLTVEAQSQLLAEEMRLARAASHVTAVSRQEAEALRAAGCRSVSLVRMEFTLSPGARSPSSRNSLLFVGALDDDPSPNVDALVWFVENVLPRVRGHLGESLRLIVAGRCAAVRQRARFWQGVTLLGQVADLGPVYDDARIFVAPHRYAAGVPTKVLEAASRGVPCVISSLLATQLEWQEGIEALTANTAEEYTRAILALYNDVTHWKCIRDRALEFVARDYNTGLFRRSVANAIALAEVNR